MKSEKFTLTNHTGFGRFIKMSMLSAMLTLWYSGLQAQVPSCPLACNNLVQVSMDETCVVPITYDMMLEGEGPFSCNYQVEVLGLNGQVLSTSPNVTRANIGQTLTVRIRLGANSCWGQIKIEDKLPPVITCPNPITLSCYDLTEFGKPVATDNCGGVLASSFVTTLSDVTQDLNCDPNYRAKRTIRYQARDSIGNLSPICDRVIWYRKITLDSINCPLNYDGTPGNNNHLSCDGTYRTLPGVKLTWDANGNKYPDVAETGYPFFDSDPTAAIGTILGMLNNNTLCKINVTFTDTKIPICAHSFKVLRVWSILDWCTGTIKSCNQILKVIDDEGPILTEKEKVTSPFCASGAGDVIASDPYTCTATWTVDFSKIVILVTDCDTNQKPAFTVKFKRSPNSNDPDRCNLDPYPEVPFISSNGVTKVLGTPGVITGADRYRIEGMPIGRTWVRFYVKDACGNETVTTTEIDVIDKTPPVAICDEYTVVTLSNNGFARVFAYTFDDGSHDNCTPVGFQVSRMNAGCGNRDEDPISQTTPGRYVQFCCDDLNRQEVDANRDGRIDALDRGYLQVILTVWDDANQDGKFGPPFANPNYTDNSNTCMVLIKVDDKVPPFIKCPADKTIACGADTTLTTAERPVWSTTALSTPYFTDNCSATMVWRNAGTIDNCGQGVITRTFTVTDGGGRTATCIQTITVRNNTPYNGPVTVSTEPLVWKNLEHREIKGCLTVDTAPAKTGVPDLGVTTCSLVAYTYEDQVFPFVEGVCFKILRKWTVIDWCKFSPNKDPNGSTYPSTPIQGINMWSYVQIIKVSEDQKPVIATCSKADTDVFGDNCNGFVELKNSATDCTPAAQLKWSYVIDLNNDGIGANITGTTNDASGTFPTGTHKIIWTVEDMCGNQATCMYTFSVLDKKKPTPYCISQLTTVVMPTSGAIDIWAKDFDKGSTDNCPLVGCGLQFTFGGARAIQSQIGSVHYFKGNQISSSITEYNQGLSQKWDPSKCSSSKLYLCTKVGVNKEDMSVWDAAGNTDYCTVTLNVQANGTACSGARLAGNVGTEKNDMIKDVQIILQNLNSLESTSVKTNSAGHYEFTNIPENVGYKIVPDKDDDHINGVSTLDLVMIQRHILDIEKFNSAYKYIAADVNNDNRITAGDLVELRKLILGIYPNFPNNKSWRFLDKTIVIPDITNPWGVNEYITVSNFKTSILENHFMGIKVGDLNSSAVVNANAPLITEGRSKHLTLITQNKDYIVGQSVKMDITAENFVNIAGAQGTFEFDASSLEFSHVVPGEMNLNSDNVNALQAKNGKLSFSWNDFNGITIPEGKVLFTIEFRATANSTVERSIKITSDITKAEAYTKDLSEINMNLSVRTGNSDEKVFVLEQNNPNPFTSNTTISFNLPEAGQAKLTIFDITGKVLKTITNNYHKGRNELIINAEEINAQGVMFYELESNGIKATKKMIYLSK
ncbi:MAG: T9SS type A sorting domain-containing protein [Saprospiraceae bacterium]|nr:T9SS type A sorting domain-containing protein [Saprospiraceae bacterium]